jgi:hypothetical protein
MNTITLSTKADDGTELAVITYTEAEVFRFIKRAEEADAIQQVADQYRKTVSDIRTEVRDFFSEGEWSDGETTVNKGDVNMLLESIGSYKLTTKYTGTFTIHGTFNVEADDEDTATALLEDDISVDFYGGDINVDNIEIFDIEEDN